MSIFQMRFTAAADGGTPMTLTANFPEDYCNEILSKVLELNMRTQIADIFREKLGTPTFTFEGQWIGGKDGKS